MTFISNSLVLKWDLTLFLDAIIFSYKVIRINYLPERNK